MVFQARAMFQAGRHALVQQSLHREAGESAPRPRLEQETYMITRRLARLCLYAALPAVLAAASWASDGAPPRALTDPKTVVSPPNPSARPIPVEDLLISRRVQGPTWSPDGRQIAFTTNLTGRFNLWKVSADGGWPIQLAQAEDRQVGVVWSPDGKWILYQQDAGGNEQYQIYRVAADGGEPVNLTNAPQIRFTDVRFSGDGKYLAVGMKLKTSPATDVGVFDVATRKLRNLTNEQSRDHWWGVGDWSPDGKTIYATRRNVSFTDASVYRIEVAAGKAEELTPHEGEALFGVSAVSPDGRTLLITSNQKGGHENVALLDIATRKVQRVTDSPWASAGGEFSPDNQHFTYVVNEDGRTTSYIGDRRGHAEKLNFPEGVTAPAGTPNAYSPSGDRLLLSHQGAQHPSDLWIYDVAKRQARQLTFSAIASLNPALLPESQIVHYQSFDGQIISAVLWMPFNLKRDGSHPAIVIAHGGPTGQTEDAFNATAAALASRGFICIAPNVRGSTGYGIAFQKANYQDLGGGDLQDEVYATRFLAATGYVDAAKIGITGGSYGGFMTLMAVGKTPEVWAAAVEQYGVVNWLTMMQHSDAFLQSYIRSLLGDPEKDRAVYDATSPLQYLKNAKAPLLVLQGENDIRVPKEEAEQVVDIYKSNGRTVDVKFYPQEGHGYSKRENQVDSLRRLVDWFERYLKAGPASR
jgi:dipeptidyl aminopeptidase/acylaminoacyl peptidase